MSPDVATRAATALRWRAAQLAGVQAIYLVRLLIMAKLLAPEAFGLLAIASVALSFLMQLSNFGMTQAVIQHADATVEQYDAAWSVGLARAALVAVILIAAAPFVAALFEEPRAASIIQGLALRPVIEASASIGIARLTRELKFRELALIYLPGALADLATAVALAPSLGVWALVAGALVGSAIVSLVSYLLVPHRPRFGFRWHTLRPLVNYGRWVLAKGVVVLAGTFVTQLAISRMLGAAALGVFFLAVKVAFLPVEATAAVVGSVAFPMFAQLRDDAKGSAGAFATLLGTLVLVLVPVYALMFVLAPSFEQALGGSWVGTAPIVRVLAAAGVAAILSDLLGPMLMGQGRADRAFFLEALQTGVTLVLLLPAVAALQVAGAAFAWLGGNASTLFLGGHWAHEAVPGVLRRAAPRLLAALVAGVSGALAAGLIAWKLQGWAALITGGLAGALACGAALWWLDARLGLELSKLWRLLLGARGTGYSEAQEHRL